MPAQFTVGSLFAGILTGGFDLAAERVWGPGCVRWQVENSPYCCRVLAKHWPEVPRYGDIRKLDGSELAPVDLVCGGFPCQPVSVAGKGRAQADPRWLWPEFVRLLGILRPRFAVLENVPGLLARGMGEVLGDLAALGFDAEWDCLPAAAFGAPHLRDRVWIVAYSPGERCNDAGVATPDRGLAERNPDAKGRWEPQKSPGGNPPHGAGDFWQVEPGIQRVAHGVPQRVERLTALGNAVVPQVAEFVFRRIQEAAC
jgi:DNA (cytosine-5)-methyltransferase 1